MQFVRRSVGSSLDEFRATWLTRIEGELEAVDALRCVRAHRWAQVPTDGDGGAGGCFDGVRELWWPDQWSFDNARAREPEAWAQIERGQGIDSDSNGFLATVENRIVWPEPDPLTVAR